MSGIREMHKAGLMLERYNAHLALGSPWAIHTICASKESWRRQLVSVQHRAHTKSTLLYGVGILRCQYGVGFGAIERPGQIGPVVRKWVKPRDKKII